MLVGDTASWPTNTAAWVRTLHAATAVSPQLGTKIGEHFFEDNYVSRLVAVP